MSSKKIKEIKQTELNDNTTYYFVIVLKYKNTTLADKLGLPFLCVAKATFSVLKKVFIKHKTSIDKICGKCEKPIDTVKFLLKAQYPDKFKAMEKNNLIPAFNVKVVSKEKYKDVCNKFNSKKKSSSKKKRTAK